MKLDMHLRSPKREEEKTNDISVRSFAEVQLGTLGLEEDVLDTAAEAFNLSVSKDLSARKTEQKGNQIGVHILPAVPAVQVAVRSTAEHSAHQTRSAYLQ